MYFRYCTVSQFTAHIIIITELLTTETNKQFSIISQIVPTFFRLYLTSKIVQRITIVI